MENFDEQLIQLVRDCEIIYNKRSSGYKNTGNKLRKWQEIANSLESTTEEGMRRWKSLRDRYTRELKKEMLPSGSGASTSQPWYLFMYLDFLREHVAPRRVSDNMSQGNENEYNEEEVPESFEDPLSPTSNMSSPVVNPKKKSKLDEINKSFRDSMAVFQVYMKSKVTPVAVSDAQKFGETVANLYDTLNERHKKEARVEIIKYLTSLSDQELENDE